MSTVLSQILLIMTWLSLSLLIGIQTGGCTTVHGSLPVPLSKKVDTGETFMGIRLLGTLRLPDKKVDGLALAGMSDLAWDEDEQILYALSDLGHLFHLRPLFADDHLADVEILSVHRLKDVNGRGLVPPWKDSEGMTVVNAGNGIRGDSELIVCFEVKQRIRRYTPTGERLGEYPLPPPLQSIRRFANPNISLESITLHPRWGVLVAPEWPLRDEAKNELKIYSSDGRYTWRYPLYPAANSALVSMETLSDGSLLTLERAFVSVTRPLVIALRRTELTDDHSNLLNVKDVAVFSTGQGWLLDNFEGLSAHRNNRFFMISDDNRNFLQSTLLVYFELLNSPP